MPRQSSSSNPTTIRIAPTNAEPLASLRIYRVAVEAGGHRWLIPATDATGWLEILLAEDLDPEAIFPGLCGPAVIGEVNELLIDGTIGSDEMQAAICDAITAASGRTWWITLRLCRFLRAQWDQVGGELAAHGVRSNGVPLAYWLDGAYATILRLLKDHNPENLTKFTSQLTMPPPGMAREAFDQERNREAFKAAMQRAR